MLTRSLAFALPLFALAACGNGDDTSVAQRVASSQVVAPEEFGVLPQKPLQLPENLADLPEPTPGAVNRTDLTPERDLLVALSGRPERGSKAQGDGALLSLLARAGIDPDIRQDLAAEDIAYRRNNRGRLLERLAGQDGDLTIYNRLLLDPEAEAIRLRARGLIVPPAPPIE